MRLHPVVPWPPISLAPVKKVEKPRQTKVADESLGVDAAPEHAVQAVKRDPSQGQNPHSGVDILV